MRHHGRLVTNETSVLRQSLYYPYAWALKYARGRVLDVLVESETYAIKGAGLRPDFARDDRVPFVDVVATLDPADGQLCLLMLNRDLQAEREVAVDCRDFMPVRVLASETLTGADLKAANTFERPAVVVPRPLEAPRPAATMTFKLPARSYSVVHIATS
jgi:alpha-L-arabinofuranosidase